MSPFVAALLAELCADEDALAELARSLGQYIAEPERAEDGWLNAKNAAAYLGLTTNALHKLTAAREIPFEQDGRGGKLWFRRSELDAWRRGESQPRGTKEKGLRLRRPEALS